MAIAKRKKKFFEVEIPVIAKQTQLQAFEIKEINNRYIKYDLTRILRGKGMEVQFKVKVESEKAIAEPRKLTLMNYFLKRMIRKGTNYVEESFSTKCKNAQIRIKPFLITRRKVSRAVRKALREKCKEELIDYCKKKTANELFEEIIKNKLQKQLSLKLKKVYPLSLCEIRVLKIEKDIELPKEEIKEKVKEEKSEDDKVEEEKDSKEKKTSKVKEAPKKDSKDKEKQE